MRLLLVGDDGQILDSTDDFTRDEWDNLSPVGALAILDDLNADAS